MNFLARILNNSAPKPWLIEHQNARLLRKRPTDDGHRVLFYDDDNDEVAFYETDPIGNVKAVEVYEAGQ